MPRDRRHWSGIVRDIGGFMKITHAGFDPDAQQWQLWAETSSGQQWCIPVDEATVRALLTDPDTKVVEFA